MHCLEQTSSGFGSSFEHKAIFGKLAFDSRT